jgi:NTE family protein
VGPDEIWVIQINPTEVASEPRTVAEIADRRNELAGNLSLYQELHMIEKIDELIENRVLVKDVNKNKYRQVTVRIIEMARTDSSSGVASKLNRDPAFLKELEEQGKTQAGLFLDALRFERAWRDGDSVALTGQFAEDCEIESAHPFRPIPRQRGAKAVQQFISEHLAGAVQVDPTRKQVSADRVIWQVRSKDGKGERLKGQAEARFDAGKVTGIRLAGLP